jgi:hypothetical protein
LPQFNGVQAQHVCGFLVWLVAGKILSGGGGGGSLYNSVHRLVLFHFWFALVEV